MLGCPIATSPDIAVLSASSLLPCRLVEERLEEVSGPTAESSQLILPFWNRAVPARLPWPPVDHVVEPARSRRQPGFGSRNDTPIGALFYTLLPSRPAGTPKVRTISVLQGSKGSSDLRSCSTHACMIGLTQKIH